MGALKPRVYTYLVYLYWKIVFNKFRAIHGQFSIFDGELLSYEKMGNSTQPSDIRLPNIQWGYYTVVVVLTVVVAVPLTRDESDDTFHFTIMT